MMPKTSLEHLKRSLKKTPSPLLPPFKALSDKTRFDIFVLLFKRKGLCVTDVARIASISTPAASHHLHILEQARLIRRERNGQMICYTINKDTDYIRELIRLCARVERVV